GLPDRLPSGSAAIIGVRYAPSQTGTPDHGLLEIQAGRSTRQVQLIGNAPAGPGCRLAATPAFLSFGTIGLGISRTQSFRLTNVSPSDACTISSVALDVASSPAFHDLTPATLALPPGQGADVSVSFTPMTPGIARGTAHVVSNDTTSPLLVTLFGSTP